MPTESRIQNAAPQNESLEDQVKRLNEQLRSARDRATQQAIARSKVIEKVLHLNKLIKTLNMKEVIVRYTPSQDSKTLNELVKLVSQEAKLTDVEFIDFAYSPFAPYTIQYFAKNKAETTVEPQSRNGVSNEDVEIKGVAVKTKPSVPSVGESILTEEFIDVATAHLYIKIKDKLANDILEEFVTNKLKEMGL